MNAIVIAPAPHLVVFGRDTAGKPHASWFDQPSAELATKAAGLMNMHAVPIKSDALRELARSLPKGRVFSSGRAFTPYVAGKLYTQLVELTRDGLGLNDGKPAQAASEAPATEPKSESAKGRPALQLVASDDGKAKPEAASEVAPLPSKEPTATPTKSPARPSRVEDIGIGSLVLATTGPAEGWWEAEVIGTNGNMLALRWRDYNEPTVVRRRTEVSFLPAFGG